ncbi:pyrroline-5-carboxylate reductase [Alysiella filiformis]|uniref:Pyrroline-5-carboxylate reductase n=1 Tax=Alysiella filiformis DSM 16848 TaxID=1120981 RepID=A0A286EIE6_9NEIS|nr:pyrroline-5-carboxylate reductase [Alysiella filiformis]QMT31946.1 pyrroline-5-carboxylate reductase [Alysiella filiformis]UBQ57146.1 pyrroline-5-carboxylate reductase [Alysiella filiformis DSM 16848]SOD70666.1 pyrroline-5-carboxylate reductase [Alysiella filiformis DSM 16848]
MTIYFLGGGNMARAIIAGLRAQSPDDAIFVANRSAEKNARLQQDFHVATDFRLPETLSPQDVLILAVKPQDMKAALQNVRHGGALILSLAAGLAVDTLANWLGTHRIVRVMPNTPCAVGLGVSGLFAAEGMSASDCAIAEKIMAACGVTIWLNDEKMMNAITAISGSGSAYVFYLMNALQKAAAGLGFADETARTLALNTFRGAVALAEQSGEDFFILQQQVTSKGGTTFAALTKFEECGVADGLTEGVHAAATRSAELAQILKD